MNTLTVLGNTRDGTITCCFTGKWVRDISRTSGLPGGRLLLGQRLCRSDTTINVSRRDRRGGSCLELMPLGTRVYSVVVQIRLRQGGWLRVRIVCQRIGRVMRAWGRCSVVALNRLVSDDPVIWARDVTRSVISATGHTGAIPATLGGGPLAHAGLILLHNRVLMHNVGVKRVLLVPSAL